MQDPNETPELNPFVFGTQDHELWEAGVRNIPAPAGELLSLIKGTDSQAGQILEARINFLKAQSEFLGADPLKEENNELFVKRLVRYSAAQAAVIEAQTILLTSLGIL